MSMLPCVKWLSSRQNAKNTVLTFLFTKTLCAYNRTIHCQTMIAITCPRIILPLLQFLSPRDYGNLLCTCSEAASYDYKVIWRNYTLTWSSNKACSKSMALIMDLLHEYNPLHLLYEQVTSERMRTLLTCFRRLVDRDRLKQVYDIYMKNPYRCKAFDTMVRMERTIVAYSRHALHVNRRSRR
jgi:hypothetical protein